MTPHIVTQVQCLSHSVIPEPEGFLSFIPQSSTVKIQSNFDSCCNIINFLFLSKQEFHLKLEAFLCVFLRLHSPSNDELLSTSEYLVIKSLLPLVGSSYVPQSTADAWERTETCQFRWCYHGYLMHISKWNCVCFNLPKWLKLNE